MERAATNIAKQARYATVLSLQRAEAAKKIQ
uniref:Uncharacterized protein n=1 Tax=Magnetococcus massalia (strain MO-1) TaxID=451514 RepID=A0A1S7LGR1_MAGMO|nr:protein of unknown function [Candidatus Magnetococcus massalia]